MSKSILIIGGGVIGLCVAYYAMREGHQVTLLERNGAERDACSHGNAGMIVPSHFVPLAAPGMVGLGLRMMTNAQSPFYIRPRLDAGLMRWSLAFCRSANAGHVTRSAPLLRDLNLASRVCYEELADTFGNAFGLVKNGLLMLCRTERTLHEESLQAEHAQRLGLPALSAGLPPVAAPVHGGNDAGVGSGRRASALECGSDRLARRVGPHTGRADHTGRV